MEKYLYLLINLCTVLIPLVFSFYAKAPFYKTWRYIVPAILVPAIIFIAWDEIFTRLGIWGFNEQYLTGTYLGHLPLEEVLFFICIPYACMFTYFALNHLIEKDYLFPHQELITSVLIVVSLVMGMYNIDKLYTGVTLILLGLGLAFQMLKLRTRYMGRFYFAFAVILIPFFIVNGILTGSFIDDPVVWYNDAQTLGIRLGTIPFEDVFYAILLMLLNIGIYEWAKERHEYR